MTKTAERVVAKALSEWFSLYRSETNPEVVKIVNALREAGMLAEPEWEYGYTSKWGYQKSYDLAEAEFNAERLRQEVSAGRSSGDLKYHGKVVRRRVVNQVGEWEEIPNE